MRELKHSKQRDAIKAFLTGNISHPTADDVYAAVKEEFSNVSLATVYRNLKQLSESGDIRRLTFDDGPDRFDYNTSDHSHFKCRCCGRVRDIFASDILEKNRELKKMIPGSVDSYELTVYGICSECGSRKEVSA